MPIRYIFIPDAGSGSPYTLTADHASFTLTGNAAGLTAQRKLAAASASFTLNGYAASLTAQRKLAAAVASFTLTGIDATLTYTPATGAYSMLAETASFTLTGNDANLRNFKLVAETGSFTLTGRPANLTYGTAETVITAGAGYPIRKRKPRKAQPRISDIIERSMREMYEQITETAKPQAAKKAAKIVKPHVIEGVKPAAIPQATVIDWDALEQDASRVSALLDLWQSQMEAQVIVEEEEMMLLLLAA